MMELYGKRRWPAMVFFGSYRELGYRVDISAYPETCFKLRTHSGPGFRAEILRGAGQEDDFIIQAADQAAIELLNDQVYASVIKELLSFHFSRIEIRHQTIECLSFLEAEDLAPEGAQLCYCMSLVHRIWSAAPWEKREKMRQAEFLA